jgi:hypothetical protein
MHKHIMFGKGGMMHHGGCGCPGCMGMRRKGVMAMIMFGIMAIVFAMIAGLIHLKLHMHEEE